MKNSEQPCEFEARTEEAIRTDRWTVELRAHTDQCSYCSGILATAGDLGKLAREASNQAPRLDPLMIMLQAKLRESATAQKKEKLLVNAGMAACVTVTSAGIVLSSLEKLRQLDGAMQSITFGVLQELWSGSWPFCFLLIFLSLVWTILESEIIQEN
jgi:hypothetical protein